MTKKSTETQLDTSKEIGLEVNSEKTKYMLLSSHQNSWQNRDTEVTNTSLKNVVNLKYLGKTVANQN
jgi:hypothetical protein